VLRLRSRDFTVQCARQNLEGYVEQSEVGQDVLPFCKKNARQTLLHMTEGNSVGLIAAFVNVDCPPCSAPKSIETLVRDI
jgi:hypothetical protein